MALSLHAWAGRLAVACLLAAAGLPLAAKELDCLPPQVPDYAQGPPRGTRSALVFLHGLHGDARGTWTASSWLGGDIAAWPCLVLKDTETFRGTSVYLASYRSLALRSNPTTEESARQIAQDLATQHVFDHEHVTLVAHSMGGIVVARMLTVPGLLNDAQRQKVRLVIFVGTPALPTDAARLCDLLGANSQCGEMSDAAAMTRLWADWDRLKPRPATWCVAEGADMWFAAMPPWQRIVPEASAFRPCPDPLMRSRAAGFDHAQVVKPEGGKALPHRLLSYAFAACVRPLLTAPPALSAADKARTDAARNWFQALQDALRAGPRDPQRLIVDHMASTAQARRFPFPVDLSKPSFAASAYSQDNDSSFAQAAWTGLALAEPAAKVEWIRSIATMGDRLADGAMKRLVEDLGESVGLEPTDLLLALPQLRSSGGLLLLVLRPGAGRQLGDAPASGFGLAAALFVPLPAEGCREAAA